MVKLLLVAYTVCIVALKGMYIYIYIYITKLTMTLKKHTETRILKVTNFTYSHNGNVRFKRNQFPEEFLYISRQTPQTITIVMFAFVAAIFTGITTPHTPLFQCDRKTNYVLHNNNNNKNTAKPAYNGTARDWIFSLTGRFLFIQTLSFGSSVRIKRIPSKTGFRRA
jgi:hypothetical protein